VNHNRLYRVYREAGLCLKRKRRKHCTRSGLSLSQTTAANQEWALDFAHDRSCCGTDDPRVECGRYLYTRVPGS
jgi:hypothetical protein